jgi:hypothetical protein
VLRGYQGASTSRTRGLGESLSSKKDKEHFWDYRRHRQRQVDAAADRAGRVRQADVVRVVALTTADSQASYAFAPAVFGVIREATGQDGGAAVPVLFITAAGLQVAGAQAWWVGRDACAVRRETVDSSMSAW